VLLLVLILVLIAFGLLVVALLTGSVLWAWVSVGVSVAAAAVLLIDWLQRRSAVKAGAEGAPDTGRDTPFAAAAPVDVDPITEILPVIPQAGSAPEGADPALNGMPRESNPRFDQVPDAQQTVVMPVVQPSGSTDRPSGATPSVTSSSGISSPTVTMDGVDRSASTPLSGDEATSAESADSGGRGDAEATVLTKSPFFDTGDKPDAGSPDSAAQDEPTSVTEVPVESGAEDPDAGKPGAGTSPDDAEAEADEAGGQPAESEAEPHGGGGHPPCRRGGHGHGRRPATDRRQQRLPRQKRLRGFGLRGFRPRGFKLEGSGSEGPVSGGPAGVAAGGVVAGGVVAGGVAAAGSVVAGSVAGGAERAGAAESAAAGSAPAGSGTSGSTASGSTASDSSGAGLFDASPHASDEEPPEESRDAAAAALVAGLEDEVVVVDEQPRYHLTACRSLVAKVLIPLPVREAVELGFTPCGWCCPDRALVARHPAPAR
jgi:hypothetical protein